MFLSAQQIHAELEEEGTKVGLATVYRNLQSLAEADLVDTVRSDDGEALYRLCTNEGHHHHTNRPKHPVPSGAAPGLRVKMCVWLGVSRGLDLAFLNAD